MEVNKHNYATAAVTLLQKLIATPSFSKEEDVTALILFDYLQENGATPNRHLNNVWSANKNFDPSKPTILLNSHHDTVKPNAGYTLDPYNPIIKDGKLYGLGSNDAGASLVSLLHVFLHYYTQENLAYNIFFYIITTHLIFHLILFMQVLQKKKFLVNMVSKVWYRIYQRLIVPLLVNLPVCN